MIPSMMELLASNSVTCSMVQRCILMSSVFSGCGVDVFLTPLARNVWQMLFIELGLGADSMNSCHSPPLYPVSSNSSRFAASMGDSPLSIPPAGISKLTC